MLSLVLNGIGKQMLAEIFSLENRRKNSQIINADNFFLFYLLFYFMNTRHGPSIYCVHDRDRSHAHIINAITELPYIINQK
jgi:hypothetical protein